MSKIIWIPNTKELGIIDSCYIFCRWDHSAAAPGHQKLLRGRSRSPAALGARAGTPLVTVLCDLTVPRLSRGTESRRHVGVKFHWSEVIVSTVFLEPEHHTQHKPGTVCRKLMWSGDAHPRFTLILILLFSSR
jgi:hypothetical protein